MFLHHYLAILLSKLVMVVVVEVEELVVMVAVMVVVVEVEELVVEDKMFGS
jgi:hypothetical protein